MKEYRGLMIFFIIIFLFVLPIRRVSAVEEKQNIDSEEVNIDSATSKDLDKLYQFINEKKTDSELLNELDPMEYIKSYLKNGKGNITVSQIGKAVVSLIFKEVYSVLKLAISLIAIALLCSLLKNLQDAFSTKSISQIAFYACFCMIILVLSKSFLISISVAKDVIFGISEFMNALLPILVSMIALAGGVTEAATIDPIVMTSVIIIPKIYTTIIIPLILIGFVLKFVNNISEEHKIDNLCKMIKQVTMWMQGIILTAFIAMLTIRGITSSTIDAVTLKTTKFVVDNFVPIVGKAFSDAITSVAGYSLILKNAVSGIGLIIIVLIVLHPIIKIVLMALVYKLAAALVEPISDKRITSSIEAASDSLIMLLSTVLSVSFMFFVLIAIMASAGKFIVGG